MRYINYKVILNRIIITNGENSIIKGDNIWIEIKGVKYYFPDISQHSTETFILNTMQADWEIKTTNDYKLVINN